MKKWLVVQQNTEGRPCGWGLASDREEAKAEAKRQWDDHYCYVGEEKGGVVFHEVEATHQEG